MPTTTTPTSPETPSARRRPCGMLELRRDAGGLRHYLLGHPVRAGAELEVQLADGYWLAGHYEWSFHPDAPARLYVGLAAAEPAELALSAEAVLRRPLDA